MNVQLYAYENGTRYELDLYQEEPIKITLSAEEITDPTQINSSFSRQFRIPATGNNSRFFKYWYIAGVVDFDVTQKVVAEIHVDGILYRTGQLRLQAAYSNGKKDHIEFEVVFLGETKDFSSQVGESYMTDLDLVDTAHILDKTTLENSWLDFTDPNVLVDGKVRYILAERGYDYDADGYQVPIPGQTNPSQIIGRIVPTEEYDNSFMLQEHAIDPLQFTPIIQVKYLIDKIFERTSYTYDPSSVFNEAWFKNLYTDGLTGLTFNPNSNALFNATASNVQPVDDYEPVPFNIVNQNNANAYSNVTYKYTAPADGDYEFDVYLRGIVQNDGEVGQPAPTAEARLLKNGSSLWTDTDTTSSSGVNNWEFTHTATYTLNAGDEVWVDMVFTNYDFPPTLFNGEFAALNTPEQIGVNDYMKPDVKQIDFLKSILTKFRLVMVPAKDSTTFFIQPWEEYIGSGNDFDWTNKLDYSKDVVLEPIFFDQAQQILFTDQEDIDVTNTYHQNTFNNVYGERTFTSDNELLSDSKTIDTIFAPTPVNAIDVTGSGSDFIIPKLYEQSEDTWLVPVQEGRVDERDLVWSQHSPITPVPRLLYWNGMRTTGGTTWYYGDQTVGGSTSMTTYPCASYLSEIPSTSTTLNLNWKVVFAYFSLGGGPVGNTGESVYDRYWKTYIENIYSPDARQMTAYFNLSSEDLRNLTFDDVIFIKDSYWRLQKLYDAPLGEIATVKCELVKILDYVPPQSGSATSDFDPLEYSEEITDGGGTQTE
jgi:hypothetical protein